MHEWAKNKLSDIPAEWNALTERVIGCAIEVHRTLGSGLLERLYEEALAYELERAGIPFERQALIRIRYKDVELGDQRVDLLVDGILVIEIKATEGVSDAHLAQLVSYLRSGDIPLGLLINFHTMRLTDGVYRRVHIPAVSKHPH